MNHSGYLSTSDKMVMIFLTTRLSTVYTTGTFLLSKEECRMCSVFSGHLFGNFLQLNHVLNVSGVLRKLQVHQAQKTACCRTRENQLCHFRMRGSWEPAALRLPWELYKFRAGVPTRYQPQRLAQSQGWSPALPSDIVYGDSSV